MYFETHSHYDFSQYDKDRDELLGSILPNFGVNYILNIGCDIKSSRTNIALSQKYDHVYAAVGFHPHDAKDMTKDNLKELERLAKLPKVVAIGEIGLDFFRNLSSKDVQYSCFLSQLELAKKLKLPVIIHSRNADNEVYSVLQESEAGKAAGGVLHCFSGSLELARAYLDMGFYIGIGGMITYKNNQKLQQTVRQIPLDRLLIETDCPFLSPEPLRGSRNDSQNLQYIAAKIAELKEISQEELVDITTKNAINLFLS